MIEQQNAELEKNNLILEKDQQQEKARNAQLEMEKAQLEVDKQTAEAERQKAEAARLQAETDKLHAQAEQLRLEAENARLETKAAQLEAEKQKAEADKLQAQNAALHYELQFLRAQINPHFILNTINTFYGKAMLYDEAFANAIVCFSDILHYTLQDHTKLVTLQEEVTCIENFIEVYKLQHKYSIVIDFAYSGDLTIRIPSALLISFVENAFKYGDITDPQQPLSIALHVKDDTLMFMVRNLKRHTNLPRKSTGIGIANTRTRLQHLYPDRYELHITQDENTFQLDLTIDGLSQPVLSSPYTAVRL